MFSFARTIADLKNRREDNHREIDFLREESK